MPWRCLLAALLLLPACNRDAIPGTDHDLGGGADLSRAAGDLAMGGADFSSVVDLAATPDLAGFCGDPSSARIQLNNMLANSPAVTASPGFLNCCDSGALEWDSMQIATPIVLLWRHQVGMGPNPPIVLDLANLPSGWSVSIVSGCNPVTDGTCQPSDRYDSGITGTLSISGNIGAPQMSACASVDEGTTPHPVMHSVHAWTPPVSPP